VIENQKYDHDQEGQADEIVARESAYALSRTLAGEDLRQPRSLRPCIKKMDGCAEIDWMIRDGYAICENCYEQIHGSTPV
jgi:hypothetical protein